MRGTPKEMAVVRGKSDSGSMDKSDAILVIDDDYMNAQLYTEIGELTGWTVFTAEDGEGGLGKAREMHPDVILLDLMMPKLDGFAVLSSLRRDPILKSIPVVVVTAIDEEGSSDRARYLGAVDYVKKPFSVLELKEKVVQALQVSHERRLMLSDTENRGLSSMLRAGKNKGKVEKGDDSSSFQGPDELVDVGDVEGGLEELLRFIESQGNKRRKGAATFSLMLARLGEKGREVKSTKVPCRNKLVNSERQGAPPARTEEQGNLNDSERRETQSTGMDRRSERSSYSCTGPKPKDWRWLAETVLMFTRRPQWLFRLDEGFIALYMVGLDRSAVIQSAYNLYDAIITGLGASGDDSPAEVHLVCCPCVSYVADEIEAWIKEAKVSMQEADRIGKGVTIWETNPTSI